MNETRNQNLLCAALLVVCITGARAEQTITFNVPVQLSNLYSDVKSFSVGCNLRKKAQLGSYAYGRTDINISKNYSGTVAVPVKVPDSVASQVDSWSCGISLFHVGGGCSPAENAPLNACKAKTGAPLITEVQGSL